MGKKRPRVHAIGPFYVLLTMPCLATLTLAAGWPDQEANLADRLRKGPGMLNHPVGVVPSSSVKVPTGWPLAPDGTITCTTCHASLPSLSGQGKPMLRGGHEPADDPTDFCLNCHRDPTHWTAAGMHWMAMSRAHVTPESDERESARSVDDGTRQCLSCHDGVNAGEAAYDTPWNRGGGSVGDSGRNHPVGVSYPRAGKTRANVRLRPATLLPEAVRLPGGAVSCLSCHNLYASTPKLLSVPIEGSRLCMTCHQME
ncbi:MAG: cytochrome c3 family protein [Planctomycetota bacterium]